MSSENEHITYKKSNPVELYKNAIRAFLLQNNQRIYSTIYYSQFYFFISN